MMSFDESKIELLPSMGSEKQPTPTFRRLRIFTLVAILALSALYLATPSSSSLKYNKLFKSGRGSSRHTQELPHTYTSTYPSSPLNSTLGFEKIYVLSLPHRADKRDELAIMAYASDLDLTFVDGVSAKDLDNMIIADYPEDMDGGTLGCYRSHVNALRKVVEDRVESAIIMEDDLDWDIDLRTSLQQLQDPWATLIGSMKQDGAERGPKELTPFGDTRDWDLIYLGACLEQPWSGNVGEKKNITLIGDKMVDYDHPPYVVYEDSTTPDFHQSTSNVQELLGEYGIDIAGAPNTAETRQRRIVQRARGPICTTSYAVTRRGAARMLYALTRGINSPVDLLMNWAVGDGRVEGYSVFPPIMDQWKVDGGSANSDIHYEPKNKGKSHLQPRATPDKGKSNNIRNSIRKNLSGFIPAPHV